MPRTPEFTEVVAGTPELLFGAVKNHHEWVPKLIPHVFTQGDRHEGDGDVGSVYHYDVHEDTHDAHGGIPKIKMVMEVYNERTLSYVVDFQGILGTATSSSTSDSFLGHLQTPRT